MPEPLPSFSGKQVLITAGPTREALDPVRFISNHSTGKMGYALAEAFLKAGAEVILVSGPVNLTLSHDRLQLIQVESAVEMLENCALYFTRVDIAVFTAAVADYRPAEVSPLKIKKAAEAFSLLLVKNPDIAHEFGKQKKQGQLSAGFALETDHELENARLKLEKKNFDLIVLNSTNDKGAAFGHDTNKIRILTATGQDMEFPLMLKSDVAREILQQIAGLPGFRTSGLV